MKIALPTVLIAVGCIGLLADSRAMAQYSLPNGPAVPAAGQPASSAPQYGAANGSPQPAGTATSQETANSSAEDSPPTGNGLPADPFAAVGCSICGGGNCAPPDWYALAGMKMMSRSKVRPLSISFRTSGEGSFAAVETDAKPAPYVFNVVNLPGATINSSNGVILENNGVMNSKSIGFGIAPGYDFTLGHYFCRDRNNNDHFVEFTFWSLNSWEGSRTVDGFLVPLYNETEGFGGAPGYTSAQATAINQGILTPVTTGLFYGSLRTPYPEPAELPGATDDQKTLSFAFNNGLNHTISYGSTMNNFELDGRFTPRGEADQLVLHEDGTWRRECRPGTHMSYLYGLRIMTVDEAFKFQSWSEGIDPFFFPTSANPFGSMTTGHGDYSTMTHNTLLGLQIGAEMTFSKCRWTWGVDAKVGPYINWATQQSTIDAYIDNQPQHNVAQQLAGSRCEASLIGETGFETTYKFRPNLIGRASYDFMWVSGLALAPDQLQFVANPINRVNADGLIFTQGVSLSLEWLW